MSKGEFLRLMDKIAEVAPGTLSGVENVQSLTSWDSMKMLEFIMLAASKFGLTISPSSVVRAKTVNDLITLLGDHVTK